MNFKISFYIEHDLVKWWLRRERICLQSRRPGFNPYVGQIPWRGEWLPTPVLLLVESHRHGNMAGYCPWGHKDLDTAERIILSLQISSYLRIVLEHVRDTGSNLIAEIMLLGEKKLFGILEVFQQTK